MTAPQRLAVPTRQWVIVLAAVPSVALGVILTAILIVLFGVYGLLPGLAVTLATVMLAVSRAAVDPSARVIDELDARPAEPSGEARLLNVMEALSATGGVVQPALHVIDDPAANLLVLGVSERDTHVIVTSGLLDQLERVELEAVLARAVTLIRRGDLPAATTALQVLTGTRGGTALLIRPVVGVLRSRLSQGVAADDDVLLDRDAVALTRYPPGLIGALGKLSASSTTVEPADAAGASLWLVDPRADGGVGRAPLADRIDALELL